MRIATHSDIPSIMDIIGQAKRRLYRLGIDQWQDGYPHEEAIRNDIALQNGYIQMVDNVIAAYAAIIIGDEPTYHRIDGQWLTDNPYIVIHRIAVHDQFAHQGIAAGIFDFTCVMAKQHQVTSIRIDTHKDNVYMQHLVRKQGFAYCGIIQVRDGKRMAFEKII